MSTSDWLQDFQASSLTRFESLDWPKRTDEYWRFANLKRAKLDSFDPVDDKPEIQLPAGAKLVPLGDLPKERAEKLLANTQGILGAEKYVAWAHAQKMASTCIVIPTGVELEDPIYIKHSVQTALAPVTLVLAEANSKASILETIQSGASDSPLVIGSSTVVAETGAHVSYCLSQELGTAGRHVHASHALVGRDAHLQMMTANFGGDWIRQECVAEMQFAGGDSEILGLNLAKRDQEIDQRTLQQHLAGHTRSDLLYKNALFDEAKSIFSGLIQVDEGAHHTDAFQTCRNLLLSERAEANAMPGLEINADQVKCSHGATSSQIDPEELFYLEARGIPESRARQLITLGFAADVVQRLHSSEIQEHLMSRLENLLINSSSSQA